MLIPIYLGLERSTWWYCFIVNFSGGDCNANPIILLHGKLFSLIWLFWEKVTHFWLIGIFMTNNDYDYVTLVKYTLCSLWCFGNSASEFMGLSCYEMQTIGVRWSFMGHDHFLPTCITCMDLTLIDPDKRTDVHNHHKPGGTWVSVCPRPFQDPHDINLWKNSLYFLLLIICWPVVSELKLVNWYVGIRVPRQGLSQCSLSHVSGTV